MEGCYYKDDAPVGVTHDSVAMVAQPWSRGQETAEKVNQDEILPAVLREHPVNQEIRLIRFVFELISATAMVASCKHHHLLGAGYDDWRRVT